jgi:hypothetical protein
MVIVGVFPFFYLSVLVLGHSDRRLDSDGAWNARRERNGPDQKMKNGYDESG